MLGLRKNYVHKTHGKVIILILPKIFYCIDQTQAI